MHINTVLLHSKALSEKLWYCGTVLPVLKEPSVFLFGGGEDRLFQVLAGWILDFGVFICLVFGFCFETGSLCCPGCPGTHFVHQAGLELRDPPASAAFQCQHKSQHTWLESESYVAGTGLEFLAGLHPQLPECWDYSNSNIPPHPAGFFSLIHFPCPLSSLSPLLLHFSQPLFSFMNICICIIKRMCLTSCLYQDVCMCVCEKCVSL